MNEKGGINLTLAVGRRLRLHRVFDARKNSVVARLDAGKNVVEHIGRGMLHGTEEWTGRGSTVDFNGRRQ